jgi:hypothetical protein
MSGFRVARRRWVLIGVATLGAASAWAQGQREPTSAGPGRIICRSITICELGVGIPPSIRYAIDVSMVPDANKDRLVKQRTPNAAPFVATVTGTETEAGIKAASIRFYN